MGYDPKQPRDPKGTSTGGQWTSTGAAKKSEKESEEKNADVIATKARHAAGLPEPDTQKLYFDASTGKWRADRAKIHDQIVDEYFKGKKPVENPVTVMMGGGAGAGKSTIKDSGDLKLPDDYINIAADDIKEKIPEYNGDNAHLVHEESSYVSKRIMDKAGKEGYNSVLDGTGNTSMESLNRKIDKLTARGQKVDCYYVTCDIEEALRRAVHRWKKEKRFIPSDAVINTHKAVSQMFPEIIKHPKINNIYLYDSNSRPGKLIFQKVNGVIKIFDTVAFNKFLDKAKWTPGGEF